MSQNNPNMQKIQNVNRLMVFTLLVVFVLKTIITIYVPFKSRPSELMLICTFQICNQVLLVVEKMFNINYSFNRCRLGFEIAILIISVYSEFLLQFVDINEVAFVFSQKIISALYYALSIIGTPILISSILSFSGSKNESENI